MIEIRSDQWTGDSADDTSKSDTPPGVSAEFADKAAAEAAFSKLEGSAFQRAEITLRMPGDEGGETVAREDDAQNLRQLGSGLTAAAAGLAAAGVVIATGGAALPAVIAAGVASGGTVAATQAAGRAAGPTEDDDATAGNPVLTVTTSTADKQARAEAVLRECGALKVWRTGDAA